MLSDAEVVKRISARLKELRLKQNISRQELAEISGVSMSSIARMEDGEIKSFGAFLRILRMLGKMDVLLPLVEEEVMSPNEYFKLVHSAKTTERKRASRKSRTKTTEEAVW